MPRLSTVQGAFPLVAGIATAAVLCAVAVFTVVRSGCEDPGSYEAEGDVVRLVGGCVSREDLPVDPAERPAREAPAPSWKVEGAGSPPGLRP
ncbi:hypothetical protein SAMN04487905_102311 [Actinopolyspora xinjiangensis]|uniref:Uncharacterized protein n=1 Tax=Actinopolyspora xinjiangensis TaxID=405564 RepID=A0A1H0QMP5_9ACTN|nr:hypothetical protein [Actinopolyspora xinjiangensis]SDP18643.1 hypothetical protein SAMN04487905_102311 [Actinopolyspora xinjiangensis]